MEGKTRCLQEAHSTHRSPLARGNVMHIHNTRDLPLLWIGFGLMAIGSLGSLSLQSDLCFNV
jgi:hypothetical protein